MNTRRRSFNKHARQSGFTLIELLVVVVIIGLMVKGVSLSFTPKNGESLLKDEAEQFFLSSRYVAEHSVLAAEIVGLFVEPANSSEGLRWCYHWRRYRDQAWRPLPNFLEDRCLPANMEVEMIVEGEAYVFDEQATVPIPVLVFYPSGESTPFEVALFFPLDSEEVERLEIDMMSGVFWLSELQRMQDDDFQYE